MINSKRGSALVGIVIFTAVVSLIVGGLLKWTSTNRLVSERNIVRTKATYAVENILENGMAQLVSRLSDAQDIEEDAMAPANGPLTIPSRVQNLYAGTDVTIAQEEIMGGPIADGVWVYIDPDDPANEFDAQKGKRVMVRNTTILAKADGSRANTGDPSTVYAKIGLQIRDTPLFTHAIFYNMDMEFHPGPAMDMRGPVHSNGNLYASAASDLYFHSAVTTAGDYHHGFAPLHPLGFQPGTVWFLDGKGNFVNDEVESSSEYYDSNYDSWAKIAMQRWGGNVLTSEHDVRKQNPIGFAGYVRDDPDTAEVDDDLNYSYSLIEPNLKVKNKVNHADNKGVMEREKFANKAGLIVRVHKTTTAPSAESHQLSPNYWVSFHKLKRTDPLDPSSSPIVNGDGEVEEVDIGIDATYASTLIKMEEYAEGPSGNPSSGFYDLRRGQGLDVVEFQVNEFRKAVDNTDTNYNASNWTSNYDPANDYNGVVFVELPWDTAQSGRKDKVVVGDQNMGVLLKDGQTLPNPTYNSTEGFTLATNNHLYVKGHYNADGDSSTGSATEADDASNPEPPASLAADAITILSDKWMNSKSKNSNASSRPTEFTEVNFGMIQGLVPTGKGGTVNESGGNHNFPRFLESWSGKTFRYRGSMVALFESEISDQPHGGSFYSPPIRDWGFYDGFKDGNFPPGTPYIRTFRRGPTEFVTNARYTQEKASIEEAFGITGGGGGGGGGGKKGK